MRQRNTCLIDVPCCLLCGQVGHPFPATVRPDLDDSSGSIPVPPRAQQLPDCPSISAWRCMQRQVHGLAYLTERRQAVGCDGVLRLGRCPMASWSAASLAWLTVSPPAACPGSISVTCGSHRAGAARLLRRLHVRCVW
jgi:hypothetical protein